MTVLARDFGLGESYVTEMVTKPTKRTPRRLFLKEWLEFRGMSVATAASRLGIERESLHRWIRQQHRLTPDKISQLANLLQIEPEELWRPPNQVSFDAILADKPEEIRRMALEMIQLLLKNPKLSR